MNENISKIKARRKWKRFVRISFVIVALLAVSEIDSCIDFYMDFRKEYKDQKEYYVNILVESGKKDTLVDKQYRVYAGSRGMMKYGPVSGLTAFIFYKRTYFMNFASLSYCCIMLILAIILLIRLSHHSLFNKGGFRVLKFIWIVNLICCLGLSMHEVWFEPNVYKRTNGKYAMDYINTSNYVWIFAIFCLFAAYIYKQGINLQQEQELTI